MSKIFLSILISLNPGSLLFAITFPTDTVEYANSGKPILVIEHATEHYYYDSTCVWKIEYPELVGMIDLALQRELNQIFIQAVSIGDCEDEDCVPPEERLFPYLSKYSNLTKVNCIRNDIISYTIRWKSCQSARNECEEEVTHVFYELSGESSGNRLSYFNQDPVSSLGLDELIISKLGFYPDDKSVLQRDCLLNFNCGFIIMTYDALSLKTDKPETISISFEELEPFINEKSVLSAFLKND